MTPIDLMDADLLAQRFVDGELAGEERIRFLARLSRESALRERLIELEQLTFDASRLPRAAVPTGFVDGVLARTASTTAPTAIEPRRWLRALWQPHAFTWTLAHAAVAASIVVAIAGGVAIWRTDATSGTPAADSPGPPPVLVRLVVLQPGATTVQLAGDFNGWNPARTSLEPMSNGAWSITMPLEPGRYEYQLVIDGQRWIVDPFATEQSDDGFGSRNAILDVRPPMAPASKGAAL